MLSLNALLYLVTAPYPKVGGAPVGVGGTGGSGRGCGGKGREVGLAGKRDEDTNWATLRG